MRRALRLTGVLLILSGIVFAPRPLLATIPGIASGIPEPAQRNVIVQLFNWPFQDITRVLPQLKTLGYSHIHISPPQRSNEVVWQWWGRYQPIDLSVIAGPLGSERDFQMLNEEANRQGIQVLVDVVFNHTVDITELPEPNFVELKDNQISSEKFPQFEPMDFHRRCRIDDSDPTRVQQCWLDYNLADLKTESPHVRSIAMDYLQKLTQLGTDGFRFDAAKHIEPDFFSEVLSATPGAYAFGEIIEAWPSNFPDIPVLDFYDFPLVAIMREAFSFGGNLSVLKDAVPQGRALPGPKAVTFVRNHDIDRGQANDRGLNDSGGRNTFGIGWDEGHHRLDRTDVRLACAFVLGREDGLPYVFVDMPTLLEGGQDDRFDDPDLVAGIRFHNLCLANADGSGRRPDIWRITTPTALGWQRGMDRFIVINKAAKPLLLANVATSLQPGTYAEIRTGSPLHVQADGTIREWSVPPRSAVRFVRVGN